MNKETKERTHGRRSEGTKERRTKERRNERTTNQPPNQTTEEATNQPNNGEETTNYSVSPTHGSSPQAMVRKRQLVCVAASSVELWRLRGRLCRLAWQAYDTCQPSISRGPIRPSRSTVLSPGIPRCKMSYYVFITVLITYSTAIFRLHPERKYTHNISFLLSLNIAMGQSKGATSNESCQPPAGKPADTCALVDLSTCISDERKLHPGGA